MHAQKNMNVYDDITLSYEIVHIQNIHTHSVYSYTFTQGHIFLKSRTKLIGVLRIIVCLQRFRQPISKKLL